MLGNKGFVRIAEAVIASLIILGILLALSSRINANRGVELNSLLPPLLEEIARNSSLRTKIVEEYDLSQNHGQFANARIISDIEDFLEPNIPNNFEFAIRICGLDVPCFLSPFPRESGSDVFAAERIISSSLGQTTYSPRKIKLFLWRKL